MTKTLSAEEAQTWLRFYGNTPKVQNFLATGEPPWGLIVNVEIAPGVRDDFLLFIPVLDGEPQPDRLKISLVTGHPIVSEVQKAPYQSPDDVGFWQNLEKQVQDVLGSAADFAKWAIAGLIGFALLQLTRK